MGLCFILYNPRVMNITVKKTASTTLFTVNLYSACYLNAQYQNQCIVTPLETLLLTSRNALATRDVCEKLMSPFLGNIDEESKRKMQITRIILIPGGQNSVKNYSLVINIKLDQNIIMINQYIKIHFNTCNRCKENERKQQKNGIFPSPRGITVFKIA